MSDTTDIKLEIGEGNYIETHDKVYKIIEIEDDGDTIVAKRLESDNREYTREEFSRILRFTDTIEIKKNWK